MVLKSVSWSDKWYVTNKKSDKGDHNATFNAWSKPYRSFKGVFIHSPLASLAWTIQRRTIQTKQNGLRISLWSVLPQWLTVWLPPRRLASIFRCCSEHGFVNVASFFIDLSITKYTGKNCFRCLQYCNRILRRKLQCCRAGSPVAVAWFIERAVAIKTVGNEASESSLRSFTAHLPANVATACCSSASVLTLRPKERDVQMLAHPCRRTLRRICLA